MKIGVVFPCEETYIEDEENSGNDVSILEDFYKNRDTREYKDFSPTLRSGRAGLKVKREEVESENLQENMNKVVRVRRLTPRECYRLMDFDDEDYDRASKVCSETNLYKQAGNSIVVAVLEGIMRQLKPYFSVE